MKFEFPCSKTIEITNFRAAAPIFYPEDRGSTFQLRDKGCPLNYIMRVPTKKFTICFGQRDVRKMEVNLFIDLTPWHQVLQKVLRRPQILKNFAQFCGSFTASLLLISNLNPMNPPLPISLKIRTST